MEATAAFRNLFCIHPHRNGDVGMLRVVRRVGELDLI
jgi:hypothetical protein